MSAETTKNPLSNIFQSKEKEKVKDPDPIITTPRLQESPAPVTLISERDAYISELLKSQPSTIEDIETEPIQEVTGVHRLSLPDYFEPLSYDCTRGNSCEFHKWFARDVLIREGLTMKRWEQAHRGKLMFRWIFSHKLALDSAKNVRGWTFANRTLFPDAPRHLFSISGAVENGDSLLSFMPYERALKIREKPSLISQEKVNLELNSDFNQTKYGGNPNFYKAKLGPETIEGSDEAPVGSLQEGRDF